MNPEDLAAGSRYPPVSRIREMARIVAIAVAREALASGAATGAGPSSRHASSPQLFRESSLCR